MEICLIRHAEPDWMPGGRHRMDPELTERGDLQAARLAVRVRSWKNVDEVWISPATRAQQTAAPMVEALGVPARTLDWLLEAQPANLEGLTREEIRARLGGVRSRPIESWWEGLPEGGESLRDFTTRIVEGWNTELAALGGQRLDEAPHWRDLPERRIVVVCHAGTSAASLGHLLGLAPVPWSWERFRLGHASSVVVRSRKMSVGEIFALDRFNDREHLPKALHTT